MRNFRDFQKEISSGKIRNAYYIAANDNYFISKAGDILREKLFGSKDSKDNFFLKYADETPLPELADLTGSFASLFASQKLVIIKRCEKYSRKMSDLMEFSKKIDENSFLLFCFDQAFVLEKKLYDNYDFFDFSDLSQRELYDWVKEEFEKSGIKINNDALDLFLTSIPASLDLINSEVEKISNYDFEGRDAVITKEIILEFTGYDTEYTPDELMRCIVRKERKQAFIVLNNLLNTKSLNEVYLLSLISNYYMDLISFKSAGLDSMDSRLIYQKYKMWGDRVKFAKNYHKSMNINGLHASVQQIIETDKKLKTSMMDPKILMTSLVEELINA